ncbi:hypothetical protein SRB5_12080 [Streptomyces sp. RB5]|uniref:Uncharacterized protein n=1 Tax=Streptomyces smaragdinus TaxID=2585196 RepID=A0A7K0CE99_9ACTN|nr:hypothetical protein [Streptomyces smaragdinus]MQY11094.1 hypothetical protein [Streptomyces smaragdinus]
MRSSPPGGLGGAPAYPLYAGTSAYAVTDLNPTGAKDGAHLDTLEVLANADHMPQSGARRFPTDNPVVLRPMLGLYSATVEEAHASMKDAAES